MFLTYSMRVNSLGFLYIMKRFFKPFLFAAAVCSVMSVQARAEIFYIEDQNDRFSVSFPDSWSSEANQMPDDKLTVLAPGTHEFAGCRVRVREDRRFVIYPGKFDKNIQKVEFSREFWDDYLGEYNIIEVDHFRDGAGLGFGHASMVEATYETTAEPIVRKRGMMFASLYHDQLYIVDCSSQAEVYQKWRPSFLGIIKSVNFKKVTHENTNGHYRPFDDDAPVEVQGPNKLDVYKF